MQGLADGYFIVPYTMGNFLASVKPAGVDTTAAEFRQVEKEVGDRLKQLMAIKGKRTATSFHRELGKLMWERCGMARSEKSLKDAESEVSRFEEMLKDLERLGTE